MVNRSQSKAIRPEHEQEPNDAPEMKDPVQPGSSDIDERMSTHFTKAVLCSLPHLFRPANNTPPPPQPGIIRRPLLKPI
ncbi:hypothetical protein PDIP_10170 [Penicillium digitatum Pd1]|uniref:Uncharacterized protein n=1 Tax=Penicillium digitatum (strain Pd1 / CECT 20795) TaxID=1170230 RepID=K9H2G9_PEND1|nr:hypothetical protein PDIP_10170 [Penicillium digitatum Pd1]EKV21063.1 hypothetical protein PDIP_10170 [Penicillium digitatum Pd1]